MQSSILLITKHCQLPRNAIVKLREITGPRYVWSPTTSVADDGHRPYTGLFIINLSSQKINSVMASICNVMKVGVTYINFRVLWLMQQRLHLFTLIAEER